MVLETESRTKIRTLVVDDDPVSRSALVRILSLLDYEVAAAADLAGAMAGLLRQPQCLILDLMLPDGNGMDVLRSIRKQQLPIRVAIVTGADKPMLAEVQTLLPDALFTKPLDVTGLIRWLTASG